MWTYKMPHRSSKVKLLFMIFAVILLFLFTPLFASSNPVQNQYKRSIDPITPEETLTKELLEKEDATTTEESVTTEEEDESEAEELNNMDENAAEIDNSDLEELNKVEDSEEKSPEKDVPPPKPTQPPIPPHIANAIDYDLGIDGQPPDLPSMNAELQKQMYAKLMAQHTTTKANVPPYERTTETPEEPKEDLWRFEELFPPVNDTPNFWFLSNKELSYENNVYLPKYRLHYCKIDKNSGSAMQATFCYLHDPEKYFEFYTKSKWNPGLYSGGRICANETTHGGLRKLVEDIANRTDFFETDKVTHFAILRHPIDRFVSAWIDICTRRKLSEKAQHNHCYGCGQDIGCFILQNYWYIWRRARGMNRMWNMDWHFYPQTWYCDFDEHLDNYTLITYSRYNDDFLKNFEDLLQKTNVEKEVAKTVIETLGSKTTSHATNMTQSMNVIAQLYGTPPILRVLYNTYYNDFEWLGFKL